MAGCRARRVRSGRSGNSPRQPQWWWRTVTPSSTGTGASTTNASSDPSMSARSRRSYAHRSELRCGDGCWPMSRWGVFVRRYRFAAVVAAMAEASSEPVRTFSIGFTTIATTSWPRRAFVAERFRHRPRGAVRRRLMPRRSSPRSFTSLRGALRRSSADSRLYVPRWRSGGSPSRSTGTAVTRASPATALCLEPRPAASDPCLVRSARRARRSDRQRVPASGRIDTCAAGSPTGLRITWILPRVLRGLQGGFEP